jgi:hypothetical protein
MQCIHYDSPTLVDAGYFAELEDAEEAAEVVSRLKTMEVQLDEMRKWLKQRKADKEAVAFFRKHLSEVNVSIMALSEWAETLDLASLAEPENIRKSLAVCQVSRQHLRIIHATRCSGKTGADQNRRAQSGVAATRAGAFAGNTALRFAGYPRFGQQI